MINYFIRYLLIVVCLGRRGLFAECITLVFDQSNPRIILGRASSLIGQLTAAGGSGLSVTEAQGASIQATRSGDCRTCRGLGVDDAGAMYGGLEAAESIAHNGGLTGIKAVERDLSIACRGIKFHIRRDRGMEN